MPTNPVDEYQDIERVTLSHRDLEASVLTRAAGRLQVLKDTWNDANLNDRLEEALNYNQRIWSFFQAELSHDSNPLPPEVKNNLLSLSLYVDRRSFETLAYPAPEKLDVLININLNIAAGLRGEGG